jgi:2-oxoisovalerate dehydrogenase E2 component (dihydrolipoyl transacylase)
VVALGGELGQMMAVGATLIRIEVEGAAAESPPAPVPSPAPAPAMPPAAAPVASRPSPATAVPPAAPLAKVLAAPAVRARALALGLDLAAVPGTGPDGRIVHADLDVLRPVAQASANPSSDGITQTKLIGLRRKIAQKMQEAKRHIPHFTYVEEVDVTALASLREVLNAQHGPARGELSPLVFIVRAAVMAVAQFPQVNARFDDETGVLSQYDAVHLGVATQTDAGLMVPVLRHAQSLDVWALSAGIARLAASARAGMATRDELTGSTLTVTSLGKLGGIVSTPVINHPEVAIVGVNRIVPRPMVLNGTVQVRQMMNLSSSFDHRVVDGAVAAAYIQRVRQLLEQPALLFID